MTSPPPVAPRAGPLPVDPRASRVTNLVFVVAFLDLVGFGLIIPLMPFYVQRLGGSARTVGVLLASFSLAQLLFMPFLGRLSDRVGRRPVILLSLIGNAIAMGLFAAATHANSLGMLFASRLLAGATAGNLAACQASIADVTHGSARAAGMGRVGAGIGLGLVVGPVLSSELSKISGEAPAIGAALLATLGVIVVMIWLPETRHARAEPQTPAAARLELRGALGRWQVQSVLMLYFLLFYALTSHQVSFALLTAQRFGWSEIQVGRSFAVLGLVMLLVQGGLVGRLVKRFRETSIFLVGAATSGSGMALLALATHPAVLLAGLGLMAFGFGLTQPILSTLASRQAGDENQGAVLGIAQSAGGLARTVGPVVGGYLFERLGTGVPYLSGAAASLLCMVLVLRLRSEESAEVVA